MNKTKLKFRFFATLKNGYRKPMEEEETKEIEVIIEAENYVSASRAFKALVNMENIIEFDSICEGVCED